MQPRYVIEPYADSVWYIIDQSKLNTSYLLFVTYFPDALNNWSINLVSVIEESYEFFGFDENLFSMEIYSSPIVGISFMRPILDAFFEPDFDVDNPVQLCYMFGAGRIRGEILPSISRAKIDLN